ncbi:Sensors of blue-light using FAD [Loktanella atrilutea]|uniref:Sensors of blue-light using FAD n=1 Tax=Loktanella atrilutea TaxID=366533 RepID=A0A1M5FQM0_LOKAT|nr:BLUF domain-containing protein [Loktanella atrilutea]SHF93451.1 Sensors of blue-light using FAD [Loktanella atrilutea]
MPYQIAYVSTSNTALVESILSDILNVSERCNTRDDISGVLMYHDRLFFQVLEGYKDLVVNCYARILRDPRHSSISLMWEGEAETRAFASWAMGYAGPDQIGFHTDQHITSLADLEGGEGSNADQKNIALLLAQEVFRNFSRGNRWVSPFVDSLP